MSEVLTEIFSLRAAEGEGVKAWISRATEMFDKCRRKVSVSFPEEAQGWLILHRSGMNEEQKAVCLARSLGDLKHESIGRAMRPVYPEFTCAKRRTNAVAVVDSQALDDDGADYDDGTDLDVREIEQFLADHDQATGDDSECFEEAKVAEALAVSWKDKSSADCNEPASSPKPRNSSGPFRLRFRNSSASHDAIDVTKWAIALVSARIHQPRIRGRGPPRQPLEPKILEMPQELHWWSISLQPLICVPLFWIVFEPSEKLKLQLAQPNLGLLMFQSRNSCW